MAEAHSAVAFSFAITHDGWDVNFDREVLYLVWESGIRSWKKRLARFRNSIHNGVYPGHLQSLYVLWTLLVVTHFAGFDIPFGLVQKALSILPGNSTMWQIIACLLAALTMWLSVIFLMRYLLKLLLMYKGWMYESRAPGKRVSVKTMLWISVVKVLSGWNKPKLYSFQGSLPRLPLPSVKDTMTRYLLSVRPLLDNGDGKYRRVEQLAKEFETGIAVKLQRYLVLKSWWSSNYVSDWWEEYVYLRGRSPLMVNSNFYGTDTLLRPTNVQAARAGTVLHFCLQFRRLIERQELEPRMLQNMVPLCSWQYERLFNTVRVPGVETDKIVHYQDSTHVAVYHRGKYYKVVVYSRGRLLSPPEIQYQIQSILDDKKSKPYPCEERLAALTAGERTHWARVRQLFFNRGHNRTSLHCIERAAFMVCLDDVDYGFDEERPEKLVDYGHILLHGNGHDRWFDKSFNLCFSTSGAVGFNTEHTWADAPVMGHLWEYVVLSELQYGYLPDGNARGEVQCAPPPPVRLQWDLAAEEVAVAIDTSFNTAQKLLNDVDLDILMFTHYGKGFMKSARVSPDAFIQMVLQLSYFRDAGHFCLTYEASMTRLYREGRTETVRSCTLESCAWVRAMEDPAARVEDRWHKFLKATQRHQLGIQDAMAGRGIDRHLFCLYVVAKYLELDSPFLQEVFNEPWRLSTSQTPYGQTSMMDLKKYPKCVGAGGGFGPVADDGYGVSYIIVGEDMLFFHVSSKKSCPVTSSTNFTKQIERSLKDVQTLFIEYKKINNGVSNSK
ncbi:carnitine O-palmitoyltransferase 1, liver isoform [Leptidea sinapis]|uniref:carnitine O-palmitoyltransferase 1, liver isoform n=1 Tax=Leptidea sinapis TaxID=189913 RepID=UPI0021364F62|nr:carnitine O-palmitoyltransferase 1, liver isoform [Leptidea sinapis]XP_050683399.1 carnitine O-palmitoyltransferase 1, liver isoform [Leptidea sinapis]XP_050683400.1 carnitine O-palmitoyltransferase 1, liver isoform [Leptidea sinapis]